MQYIIKTKKRKKEEKKKSSDFTSEVYNLIEIEKTETKQK